MNKQEITYSYHKKTAFNGTQSIVKLTHLPSGEVRKKTIQKNLSLPLAEEELSRLIARTPLKNRYEKD